MQKLVMTPPKTFEELEIYLVLNNDKLRKKKEQLLLKDLEIAYKKSASAYRELQKMDEEEKVDKDDEDANTGDERTVEEMYPDAPKPDAQQQ